MATMETVGFPRELVPRQEDYVAGAQLHEG